MSLYLIDHESSQILGLFDNGYYIIKPVCQATQHLHDYSLIRDWVTKGPHLVHHSKYSSDEVLYGFIALHLSNVKFMSKGLQLQCADFGGALEL